MEKADWAGRMARLPDEDLIEIVSSGDTGGYEAHAVEAAAAELGKRTPDTSLADRIEAEVEDKRLSEANKSLIPLSNAGWVAFVIFGVLIMWPLIFAGVIYFRGYHLKAKQALGAIPISIGLWVLIGMGFAYFAP